MAKWHYTQVACFLYLIVSGPIICDAARMKPGAKLKVQDENLATLDADEILDSNGHPWCNYFSSQVTKTYHFDIEYSEKLCEDGNCAAIELIRDKENPRLEIHGGKQWLVHKKDDELSWNLYEPCPTPCHLDDGTVQRFQSKTIDLLTVESIKLMDADTESPDQLEIVLSEGSKRNGGQRQSEVFDIEGGLYYNKELLEGGFTKVTSGDFKKIEERATNDTHAVTGRRVGKWIGGAGSVLVVGGFYTAGTLAGAAIQTQALIGAAVVGIVGGTAAGFLVGGLIGGTVAIFAALGGYGRVRGYEITSASRKIYEKLRCLDSFEECDGDHDILVPKGKKCPRN